MLEEGLRKGRDSLRSPRKPNSRLGRVIIRRNLWKKGWARMVGRRETRGDEIVVSFRKCTEEEQPSTAIPCQFQISGPHSPPPLEPTLREFVVLPLPNVDVLPTPLSRRPKCEAIPSRVCPSRSNLTTLLMDYDPMRFPSTLDSESLNDC